MRFPTRLGPGLLAMAFAAPITGEAFAQQTAGYAPSGPIVLEQPPASYQPGAAPSAKAAPAKHHHKGLIAWRHNCPDCQRARAKARDGVDVPPPPSIIPQGAIIHQGHNHGHVQSQVVASTGCAACEAGEVIVGPVTVTDTYPDGHAVSHGAMTASNMPAGRAIVGEGPEPAPVGVSRSSQGTLTPFNAMAAGGPRSASHDPSVMPTSAIPAQTALGGPVGGRPRIVSHLLGLPDLRRMRRDHDAYKTREHHAAIAYDEAQGPVSELPASMVYGPKSH